MLTSKVAQDVIFVWGLKLSLALLLLTSLLTIILLFLKGCRIFWMNHKTRARAWMDPAIEVYLQFGRLNPKLLSRRWDFRKILKYAILERSFGAEISIHAPLSQLYKRLGFVSWDLRNLHSPFWWVQAEAARCLGQMQCQEAHPQLLKQLKSKVLEVRLMSSWALGRLGNPEFLKPVVESLSPFLKTAAMRLSSIVFEMGPKSLDTLIGLSFHPHIPVRILVAHLLGELKNSKSLQVLLFMAQPREDKELRLAALKALGNLKHKRAVPFLIQNLSDPAWEIRARAAKALGMLKAESAIPALNKTLGDSSWWVRRNSGEALTQMEKKGIHTLEVAQKSHPDPFAREMALQWLDDVAFLSSTI